MTKKESTSTHFKGEELRGLFVLGLLAVLASIKVQSNEIMVTVGQLTFNIIPFLDITIILWSFYAFFMVLGLSGDILGETTSKMFIETSKMFLQFNFIALAFLSLVLGYAAYPTRLPYALGLLSIFVFYAIAKKLNEFSKKKPRKLNLKKILKANLLPLLGIVMLFCFVMILFGTYEIFVVPSFILGCVAITLYIAISEKTE